ncbi:ArsR/SmtB family transcription factor [Gracilimonas mengyeensis]|uniref:Transcriptional regulator, ArsR family n=1 Tax=Gracilimonas mengyeensis TaxID=1302730 RepID=A0A521F986_9BACT|nr:metalloregulator ArsR/SmtB family transcription factor [Gracilimonas mengyeensis]SMO92779.1 transcriptional regulator, ArsR family [Gracilimonas mengyeensis]
MDLRRDVFQAIADPTRRKIIRLLAEKPLTAGSIASNFESSRPTISKHVQILTECELLEKDQRGRKIYYHLNPKKLKEVANFLEPFQNTWKTKSNKFEDAIQKFKSDTK